MTGAPLDALLSAIPSLPRAMLDRLVAGMIDRLDELDGDPDIEPNGDEHDGNPGEDDFWPFAELRLGPGCPVSNMDYEHDGREPENEDGEEASRPPEGACKSAEAHRKRIRRTRCLPDVVRYHDYRRGGYVSDVRGYILRRDPRAPTRRQLLRRKRGMPGRPRA